MPLLSCGYVNFYLSLNESSKTRLRPVIRPVTRSFFRPIADTPTCLKFKASPPIVNRFTNLGAPCLNINFICLFNRNLDFKKFKNSKLGNRFTRSLHWIAWNTWASVSGWNREAKWVVHCQSTWIGGDCLMMMRTRGRRQEKSATFFN